MHGFPVCSAEVAITRVCLGSFTVYVTAGGFSARCCLRARAPSAAQLDLQQPHVGAVRRGEARVWSADEENTF